MKRKAAQILYHVYIQYQTWRKIRETRRVFALTSEPSLAFNFSPAIPIPESRNEPTVTVPIKWSDYRRYAYAVFLVACGLLIYSFWPKMLPWKTSEFSLVLSEDPEILLPDPLKDLTPPDSLLNTAEKPVKEDAALEVEKEEAKEKEEANAEPAYTILPEGMHLAIASKWDKTFRLYTLKNYRWQLTKEWPMLYGRKEGDKRVQGDLKTPEGRYWIKNILPGPNVGSLYGALIFTLNYPNEKDVRKGKTGGGIWIHGNEFGTELQKTRGCIKLANKSILELFDYVKSSIPVLVLSRKNQKIKPEENNLAWIEREYGQHVYMTLRPYRKSGRKFSLEEIDAIAENFVNEEEDYFVENPSRELSEEEINEILASVEEWKEAWEKREFEEYALNYHEKFKTRNGADRNSFLNRKKQILTNNDSLQIEINKVKIKPIKGSSASVQFSQEYKSFKSGEISHSSKSDKDIWLKKSEGKWRIIKE